MAKHRQGRLSEEIKKSISNFLINGAKDPRLNSRIITITGVDVTNDGSYATLYITVLSYNPKKQLTADDKQEVLNAFDKVKGYLRSEIGKRVKVRYVPELIFKLDTSFEYGSKMDKILDSLNIKPDEASAGNEEIDEFAEELD